MSSHARIVQAVRPGGNPACTAQRAPGRLQSIICTTGWAVAAVRPELAPDQSKYDPTDERLRDAAALLQEALNAEQVEAALALQKEEEFFTKLIDKYRGVEAPWKQDVVGRAYGNRGNARSRQGKMQAALDDYNQAIELCPWSVDPLLNRYDEAVEDYRAVLAASPRDPSGFNNMGNVLMAKGEWQAAADNYGKAFKLAPSFSFAAANQSLALYQMGKTDVSVRTMRSLLRRYPDFPDMRAALAAALWRQGNREEAEDMWNRVEDPRYKDLEWIRRWRRWPPRIVADLEDFLKIRETSTA